MIDSRELSKKSVLPVSMIIPVYNAEATLERCVRSINTGLLPQEIIIIDDASVDESALLANRLANLYGNIRLISRPTNGGAAEARRDGFRAAQCDYVSYVDADDYIEDGALEEAYSTLVETDSDFCVWQLWRVEEDRIFELTDLSKVLFPIIGRKAAELTLEHWLIPAVGVGKKELYLKAYAGFSLISMNADELIARLAFMNAGKVVSCGKKYYLVANPQSTTKTIHPRLLTVLDSDIWLLEFCKTHGYNKYDELLAASMADLWRLFRLRNQIGIQETREKLRRFTFDVCCMTGFFPGILRGGKPLLKFFLVGIYCRIPLFRKW
jgi:glycosyltransferase involved in cell wall biosynthesis